MQLACSSDVWKQAAIAVPKVIFDDVHVAYYNLRLVLTFTFLFSSCLRCLTLGFRHLLRERLLPLTRLVLSWRLLVPEAIS